MIKFVFVDANIGHGIMFEFEHLNKKWIIMEQEVRTLYVSDLDGTLLGSDSQLSEATVEMLKRAIDSYGAMFTCATARTPATMVPIMERVHVQLPMIAMAGAAMWHNGNYTNVRTIDEHSISKIVDIYAKHGARPFVYRQREGIIEAYHSAELSVQEREFVVPRSGGAMKRFCLGQGYGSEEHKAMIIFSIDRYDRLKGIYDEITSEVNCSPVCYHDIFNPEYGILEVYSAGTSKAQAITALAQEVGANRVVVFGDNRNDLPMMAVANHSVAVSNAFPEVLEQAHEIIGANTTDSVARWIEQDAKAIYQRFSR